MSLISHPYGDSSAPYLGTAILTILCFLRLISMSECMYSGERAGVVGTLLTGLNSSGGVIIVADASRFKRVEDGKHAGVVGALLT